MKAYILDLEATRTYEIDYANFLAGLGGATISSSEWTVPEGLTKEDESIDGSSTFISVTPAIKSAGNYTVYNKIEASMNGQIVARDRRAFLVRVRDAATFNEPGDLDEALANVRALLVGKATKDQKEYTINNRQLVRYDMAELLALESRLTQLVNQGRLSNALRNGAPLMKTVRTRFS